MRLQLKHEEGDILEHGISWKAGRNSSVRANYFHLPNQLPAISGGVRFGERLRG